MVQIPRLREWREARALTQVELAEKAGVSSRSVAGYEAGTGARPPTVRKLAEALDVEIADLVMPGKGQAPPSQLSLNNALAEERRASWEAAVEEARRLRNTGEQQMWRTLSEWRNSKKRGEPYATRRKYLDEIGNLLQEVYDAAVTLGHAYIQAALLTQGGSEASGPSALREESRATDQFYGKLLGWVEGRGLSVRTEAAQNAAEHSAPGMERPRGVEESDAA